MPTITEYDFIQQVDYPSILIQNIQNSSISIPLINIETTGSGQTMEVSLFFNDELSQEDQDILNTLMSSYVNQIPLEQQVFNQLTKDISFGMSVIAKFSAANRISDLTTTQVIQVSQQLAQIQALLNSGAITTALFAVQSLTPNAIITQNAINNYVQLLQNYLNSQSGVQNG